MALALPFLSISLYAQSIEKSELAEIQKSFKLNKETKGLQNIIIGNAALNSMALNHEMEGKIDHYFKYKVDVKGITDQQSSGRCWMFTSLNVLRQPLIQKMNVNDFQFSHNYSFFWDMFEKSNLFLENIIATAKKPMGDREVETFFKSPVNDGGVWNLFYNIGEKYGVVPQDVMPETAHSNNTSEMDRILIEKLRAGGFKIRTLAKKGANETKLNDEKLSILKDVYRILALCLGVPPTEFEWRYETKDGKIETLKSTPKDFYEMITPEDYSPEDYIMIMNDPTREYYKVYEIKNYRNTIEGINWVYLNLPNEDIKAAALKSLKNGEAMYTSCDVIKQYNSKTGISDPNMYDYEALMGIDLSMNKKARILTRQSGSSHAMTLVAVDTDENDKPTKWEFENSWGRSAGHNGFITFTDEWFDEYIFRIVIHKKHLEAKAIKSLKSKPVLLPVWDYMN